MTTVLIAILVGVISSFSKSIFDRIFREYNPDTKKLISKTKKFLHFIVKYILPISFLIFVFIDIEFNKTFVLIVSIIVSVIFWNLLIDYNRLIEKDIINYINDLNINSMNFTKEVSSLLIKSSDESTKTIIKDVDNLVQSVKSTNVTDNEQKTNKNNL